MLSYHMMQARMEVALAKERESLAEARAVINSHKVTLEERVRATEEACKRQALDDFMHDIRTEERSYVRQLKTATGAKQSIVMQERLFFRNIPLSTWVEREMVLAEGDADMNLNQLPDLQSVFGGGSLPSAHTPQGNPPAISKLLTEIKSGQKMSDTPVLTVQATAFGAQ
ncbi:MAG: hypothetical protein EXQ47_11265 [Bryobacterales bacterium]|nr:hypothetical protein [Bryobacterales bacterium]